MADLTKNSKFTPAESSAIYYFPEIPDAGSRSAGRGAPDRFKRGPFREQPDPETLKKEEENAKKTQLMVEEAFNRGLAQGRSEIVEAQEQQIKNAVSALEAVVDEIRRIRCRDVESMEVETVRLALGIAKKIIGHASTHSETVQHVVKQAMAKASDTRQLTIKLNAKDLDAVQTIVRELMPDDDPGASFRIEPDEAIEQGGCVIETKLGDIDARIDHQLKLIEELLEDNLPNAKSRE